MNQHALAVLQFQETLDLVAGHASSPLGREAVRSLAPSASLAWSEEELRRVEEMALFLGRADEWGMPVIPDLVSALRRLAIAGHVWEAPTLRDAGRLLNSARTTRGALLEHDPEFPRVLALARRLVDLRPLEEAIGRTVDEAGQVRDDASRELARLRREIRAARSQIVERLERFMASLPDRIRVSDASVGVREGRYVIPVRREGRGEVGGLVHDESATGATLFIEPPIAIEWMNRLRELELAEAREVQRILRETTDRLRPHVGELQESLEALIELDSLYARGRYAIRYGASRPDLLPAASRELDVRQGKHPLLLATLGEVVPFDLRMEGDERTLLVSGPNTGGKTVFLKSVGLISLLAQAGVLPPVAGGTRLPVFDDVFADIGDEQSIEASLSTFSAHLKNLREILEKADESTLVLVDELGSGTDPQEGAALAEAILLELNRRGTLTVATSHLGPLKLLATAEPGVVNASLQFDSRELQPTFRLQKGIPGRSYGLAIARRLGLSPAVLERAEAALPREERKMAELLEELEEKERRLADALASAEVAREEALGLRAELEQREEEVRRRERDAERRARQQARDILLRSREEVDAAIAEFRRAAEAAINATEAPAKGLDAAARLARRRVEEAARRQAERLRSAEVEESSGGRGTELIAGQRVRVTTTGATGAVVEVRDGRATVEVKGLRLQVPLGALEPVSGHVPEAQREPRRAPAWTGPELDAAPEVDLRGSRADEVAGILSPALDAAILSGLPSLRIIHGKGTGALREVVAEQLRSDRRVRSFRLGGVGEGGIGVTVAELE